MHRAFLFSVLKKPGLLSMLPLLQYFETKCGIVIGGHLRWNFIPLMKTAKHIINVDNCSFFCGKPVDVDYVAEASNFFFAEDESMDFVCSSHVMEHLANPLKAINEWIRVLKPGGIIYAGVPDKRYTFDHKRERTPLTHLIEDFNQNINQDDLTHVSDFMEKWDMPGGDHSGKEGSLEDARKHSQSRIHHHVWINEDIGEIFRYMGLKILYGPILHHDTIHIVVQKKSRD